MSSIQPITFSSDQASLGRIADPVSRSGRGPQVPEVLPPAVILPRSAAWLNPITITPSESVASSEIAPDQSNAPSGDSTPSTASQTGLSQGGSSLTGTSLAAAGQAGPAAGFYAQANALQAPTATGAFSSEAAVAGAGSVLQLV